jgi:hypothetical protein
VSAYRCDKPSRRNDATLDNGHPVAFRPAAVTNASPGEIYDCVEAVAHLIR